MPTIEIPEPIFSTDIERIELDSNDRWGPWDVIVNIRCGGVTVFSQRFAMDDYDHERPYPTVYDDDEAVQSCIELFGMRLAKVLQSDED